jgi:hypothetical protein
MPHALYCRYEARHDRAFNKTLSDLIRLRGLRPREQNGFELKERKDAEHEFKIRTLKNRESSGNSPFAPPNPGPFYRNVNFSSWNRA